MDINVAICFRDIKVKNQYGKNFNDLVKSKTKINLTHNIYIYANGTIIYNKKLTPQDKGYDTPLYYYCVINMKNINITEESVKNASYQQLQKLNNDVILITNKMMYSKNITENNIQEIKEQALKKFEKDKQNPFCKYIITSDGKILCADNEWNEYVEDVPPEYNNVINSNFNNNFNSNSNTYNRQDCVVM